MPSIAVCSLALVPHSIERLRPWGMITLLSPGSLIDTPPGLGAGGHLSLAMNDIPAPAEGLSPPAADHVDQILDFIGRWDLEQPLLVHCWAGVSRSTATAFITACALNPHADEAMIAAEIRALSPTASPNPLLVAHADEKLGRGGRMRDAVLAIGPAAEAWEGVPFELAARRPHPR